VSDAAAGAAARARPALPRRKRHLLVVAVAGALLLAALGGLALSRRRADAYDPRQRAEGITSSLGRRLPPDRPRVIFEDVAEPAGVRFEHFSGVRSTQLPEDMGSGAAWGDYDDDGDDDLLLVNCAGPLTMTAAERAASPAYTRLFRNDHGTFTDVTDEAGIALHGVCGMAAAWADYDRDGRLDVVVTAYPALHLLRQALPGRFEDVSVAAGLAGLRGFWAGASWGDYDRDGDLDLYVCGYVRYHFESADGEKVAKQFQAEVPFTLNPSSYAPERNLLLRNDGRGHFTDVARRAGVDNPAGRSLAASWADFDGDGRLDLYVANDVSDNALFLNRGAGAFEDASHSAWVADYRGAMGLAVGDWDGDGDLDIFVTHWIAQEDALFNNLRRVYGHAASGKLTFMDVADQFGLGQSSLPFVKWGTSFFDYDNDGRPDLFVVTGSTFQDPRDRRRLIATRPLLYWNKGEPEGFFELAEVSGGDLQREAVGRGAAFADYDSDGDVDVVVVNHQGRAWLLRNQGGSGRHWLKVRARGRTDPSGLGALVEVDAGGRTQVQQVGAQPSYLSQNSAAAHFGLDAASSAENVRVTFVSGRKVELSGVAADQVVTVREP
jgi:hypothetical protein